MTKTPFCAVTLLIAGDLYGKARFWVFRTYKAGI